MIEITVMNYLKEKLHDTNVYLMRPETNSGTYVLVEKTGSSEQNHLYTATIALQSYAPTLAGAIQLNESVKDAMDEIIELPSITKSQLNTDYNFTNTASKQPRYQAVFVLTHY